MPSGLTSTTPSHLVLDVAVLAVNGTAIGISQGGLEFDPGRTDRMIEFDGARAPVAEMEYPVDYKSVIKGSFIELGTTFLGYLEPGGAVAAGVTTPIACGTRYATGDYLTNVTMTSTRGDGSSLWTVTFATARINKWHYKSTDKKEGVVTCEIMAYLSLADAAVSTDKCPYTLTEA